MNFRLFVLFLSFALVRGRNFLNADDLYEDGRIVGGNDAILGDAPYMVSLWNAETNVYVCGGTIIGERWVLTTASCVLKARVFYIRTGSVLLNGGTRYDVSRLISHWNYNKVTIENNIGLLMTTQPIVMDANTRIVELPQNLPNDVSLTVTGWGLTSQTGTSYPNNLQLLATNAVNKTYCQQQHVDYTIFDSNICTLTANGQGFCNGDGGSPIVYNNQLFGLVSWGRPCAVGVPDVSTRVGAYMNWILLMMQWFSQ